MNQLQMTLLSILLINVVYLLGKFLMSIFLGVHENHIFLGFGEHAAITLRVRRLTISIGLFIPLPWLAKFYKIKNGHKDRIRFEWEYYEQPISRRLLVIFGGSISMILASMVISSVLEYHEKDTYISKQELNKYGIYPTPLAKSQGFKKGDKVIAINGEDYERFSDLFSPNALNTENPSYEVVRNKDTLTIALDSVFIDEAFAHQNRTMFIPNAPFKIQKIAHDSRAEQAGLIQGDIILEIAEKKINSLQEFIEVSGEHRGDITSVLIDRKDEEHLLKVIIDAEGKLGFYANALIEYTTRDKTLFEAIQAGIVQPVELLMINLSAMKKIFGGEVSGSKSIGGPVGIAQLFDNDVLRFFKITSILMILGAFYELLPLPKSAMLRCIPLIAEEIGHKFSYDGFLKLQRVGWWLILGLFIWSVMQDIMKVF